MVNTAYGFNTKARRQTFLSLWLFLTSIFGFIFIVNTPKRAAHSTFYALTFCFWIVGSFSMICASVAQLTQLKHLKLFIGFGAILIIGSVIGLIASWNFVATSCHGHHFCANVHFAFDFIPLATAVIICLDATSSVLDNKRVRVGCYSFILLISSALTLPYFYRYHNQWTASVTIYVVTLVIMAITSGLLFVIIGIRGSLYSSWINFMLTMALGASSLAKTISGCHYVLQERMPLAGYGFFMCHLLLTWSVSFCIVMDTKYLGVDLKKTYNQLMHIPAMMRRKRKADFRQTADWESNSSTFGTDTDTDLESLFDS